MKPTRMMLGKRGGSTPEGTSKSNLAADAAARAPGSGKDKAVPLRKEKPTPEDLLKRIRTVAQVLTKMTDPPTLGVPAKGNGQVPSKDVWKAARERALSRFEELIARIEKEVSVRGRSTLLAPTPDHAATGLVD
jgi:hypothetical protein